MIFTYDKVADAIAFVFNPGGGVVRDVEIAPNVVLGYAKDGSLTEIQILDVSDFDKPWFNLQAAAAILGLSERTIQRRIDDGIIKPKKVGREYQITGEDIEKLRKKA